MAHESPIRRDASPQRSAIPDKLYFRIGEAARLCDVPAYVLRFWESEFPQLRPNKGGTGQRLFRRRDVEVALRIRSLLYDEGYTIPGARQLLRGEQKYREAQLSLVPAAQIAPPPEQLRRLRTEMAELLAIVSKPVSGSLKSARMEPQTRRSRSPGGYQTERLFDLQTGAAADPGAVQEERGKEDENG